MQNIKNLIEAALFIAARPMTLEELQKVKGLEAVPKEEITSIIRSMEADYDSHGVRVVEEEGRFELRVKNEFAKHVEHLAPNRDFSRATLQTLSLIAFKSPVKQSEIIDIRGNRAYEHIKELLERGFIRSEPQGHTNILSITQRFLEYFNLKDIEEVKAYFAKKIASNEKKAAKKAESGEQKEGDAVQFSELKKDDAPNAADESAAPPAVSETGSQKPASHMVENFDGKAAE